MSLHQHPHYLQETERLNYTIQYLKNMLFSADERIKELKLDTRQAYSELLKGDSSISYSRIMLDANFLGSIIKNYDSMVKALKKPYFSRIDFKHAGTNEFASYYIGKTSLLRAEDNEPIIVDWRSPMASVYYDGRLGHVTYPSVEGINEGELSLKRQYTINDGKLEAIFDIDITTTDIFLQAALEENKDNRLKDIVSTIQTEQNEIIRADISSPLIVQGAAGSGKTTIALHRIAYLIYTYESYLSPDNFLIIAPNRLFLNYISEVLPELGVEQVKQTTFIDLVYDLCGINYKLNPPDKKLIEFITHQKSENKNNKKLSLSKAASQFKGSLTFKTIIDSYVDTVEKSFIPKEHFTLEEYTLYTKEEIEKMLLTDLAYLPLYKRLEELKKTLSNKLKREKVGIINSVETFYDKQIQYLWDTMAPSEERRQKILSLIDARDKKMKSLQSAAKTALAKYLALYQKSNVMTHYIELTTHAANICRFNTASADTEVITFLCSHTAELINKKVIEFEDLTPILYLQYKLFGLNKKMSVKYIVIDEAQDFSLFQIYTLKEIFHTELFTILGDLSQGIHSYKAINNWNDVLEKVFTKGRSKFLTLEQSYRTTIEIMNLANEVLKLSNLPDLVLAKPVVRHGRKPQIYRIPDFNELIPTLEAKINSLKNENYTTIAMICKTTDECAKIKKGLDKKKQVTAKVLTSDDVHYEGGILIVPSYLAKGLEFDAVIILSLNEDYYVETLDIKLLYVAITRALHSLDILCCGENLSLFNNISGDFFIT